jgi:hypothetical protein
VAKTAYFMAIPNQKRFYQKLLALNHGRINGTGTWNPFMNTAPEQDSGGFTGYSPAMIFR